MCHQAAYGPAAARFLPRWDSVIIGYHVCDRILPEPAREVAIRNNGDFLPTSLVDGWVAGTWSVDDARDRVVMRHSPLQDVPAPARAELETEVVALARFIAPEAADHDIRWDPPLS